MIFGSPLSTENFIQNYKDGVVYVSQFDQGKIFSRAYTDGTQHGYELQISPRICVTITYISEKEDISRLEISKLDNGVITQQVALNKFSFEKLHQFLNYVVNSDLAGLTGHHSPDMNFEEVTEELRDSLKTLCKKKDVTELLEALLDYECITSRDIVNTGYRKKALDLFDSLINVPEYWITYAEEEDISTSSEEKVLQHFLEKNQWIFGYGLDYRFLSILQREAHLSDTQVDGSEGVIGDYLMGDRRFTTFVELKKPSTPLFANASNRSGSWRLSNDLFYSVSQILEQKAAGTLKLNTQQQHVNGEPISQKTYDSKVVLVIGNWREVEDSGASTLEKEKKKKTLELFRSDSRNIDIITFDELLERARFIVEQGTPFNGSEDFLSF